MIWKNMEIHNVAELVEKDGGVTWVRVPERVRENMETQMGPMVAGNATGVELRFVMKGDEVKIRMASLCQETAVFHVFWGAIQGGWEDHEVDKYVSGDPREYVIRKRDNMATLKRMAAESGQEWDPEVVRVVFDRGNFVLYDVAGEMEPPKKEQCPRRTLLAYGSSITHGSNSLDASHSWVWQGAYRLQMDYRNLGMAGSWIWQCDLHRWPGTSGGYVLDLGR